MNRITLLVLAPLLACSFAPRLGATEVTDTSNSKFASVQATGLSEVRWTEGFWADRFATCRDSSVPAMWELMKGNCDVADTWPVTKELLTAKSFDVVLLDLRMPEMDGFEVFQRLGSLQIPYRPRIYAMTRDATETRRQQVAAAGFDGFLAKPFPQKHLATSSIANQSCHNAHKSSPFDRKP